MRKISRGALAHALTWAAGLWLALNVARTYFLDGGRTSYRVEAAAFIFVFMLLLAMALRSTQIPELEPPRKTPAELGLIAVAVWLFVSWPCLHLPFMSDDFIFLARFTRMGNVWTGNDLFRPLFNSIFYILNRAHTAHALWLHGVNLLLHLACAVMVFRLGVRLLGDSWRATLLALMFLLNPLQPEAVAWISGLQETSWLLLVLLALDFHSRCRLPRRGDVAAAALFSLLALLCKETALVFMPLALLLDFLHFRWRRGRSWPWLYVAYVVPLAAYLLARSTLAVMQPKIGLPSVYALKSFLSAPYRAFILPWNSAFLGSIPWLAGLIGLALTAGIVVAAKRQKTVPRALAGAAIVILTTLPVNAWLFIAADLQGSRYLYGAAIGWALIVTSVLDAITPARGRMAVLLAIVLCSSLLLHENLKPWIRAGRMVEAIAADVRRGRAPSTVPDNYYGAYVLRNGYVELKALRREK